MFQLFEFKIANEQEREQALELRHATFMEGHGYLLEDGMDDAATHLVALDASGTVVATVRILGPEYRPFELENFVDVRAHFDETRRVALIGRFSVRRENRAVSRGAFLQAGMLKASYDFAKAQGYTDFVMYTVDRLRRFYRGALFTETGETFVHPDCGDVMYVLRMDLLTLEERCSKSRSQVARLLTSNNLPEFALL